MPVRWVRGGVAGFFLLYLLAVTWPLGTAFGRAEPLVLGLPFSFFWPALWIVMGGVALAILDRSEERTRGRADAGERHGEPPARADR